MPSNSIRRQAEAGVVAISANNLGVRHLSVMNSIPSWLSWFRLAYVVNCESNTGSSGQLPVRSFQNRAKARISSFCSFLRRSLARANLAALTKADLEEFTPLNIGTGEGNDVNQLESLLRSRCEQVRKSQGHRELVPAPLYREARAGDLRSSLVDATKAKSALGWEPRASFPDGLSKTVSWFTNASS